MQSGQNEYFVPSKMALSVLILTKDEEHDLPACLESVRWSDDVHVLDSHSTDATVEVARSRGAMVTQRAFDGYASQRNFGLHSIPYKNAWVLMLDADERVPEGLRRELATTIENAPLACAAGRLKRRDYWWGKWLKHASISPFGIRLVRPERVRYEREINEQLVVNGEIRDLESHFDHYPFSKGLNHWIHKHNIYSQMEAELIASGKFIRGSWSVAMFGRDSNERRLHQKALFYRMPFRPIIKFVYMLFARGAILDGLPGLRYAILQMIYEYFIVLKTKEIQLQKHSNES